MNGSNQLNNSAPSSPWLRRLVVTIGPVEEWRGEGAGSAGDRLQFTGDGTAGGFRISCTLCKNVMGQPSPSTISIYNLKMDTRNAMRKNLTKVVVEAGWSNTEMTKVFQGSFLSCVSERQGPDIISKISALPGYGALTRSASTVTYAEGLPVKEAVKDLAGKLPGVTVSDEKLKEVGGSFGSGGWSFAGYTKDALTALADEFGFSWTVDDGNFQAVGDKAKFDEVVALNGREGGLISLVPVLEGPEQTQNGVHIKSVFVPSAIPGGTVRVKSAITPGLDGDYRIGKLVYNLDTHSDVWTMDIESAKTDGGS